MKSYRAHAAIRIAIDRLLGKIVGKEFTDFVMRTDHFNKSAEIGKIIMMPFYLQCPLDVVRKRVAISVPGSLIALHVKMRSREIIHESQIHG
ncbi:MAG: hypothetical protein ACD_39C00795G0001 [uncultured bacterium]|nr:MAG: hypothetical protein ACD_39C00795G0001 [uncultured bacterium]